MTSIEVTAAPDSATVDVVLTLDGSAVTRLVRTDSNGSADVRVLAGQLPTVATGTAVFTDHEAAAGPITYTAHTAAGKVYGKAVLDLATPWLMFPIFPQYSLRVDTITGLSHSRESASTVHPIIGRPDPLVTIGPLRTRRGTFDIHCPTYAYGRRIETAFSRGQVVLLRQNVPGLDMYFLIEGTAVDAAAEGMGSRTPWKLTIRYVEVLRPVGLLSGSYGWTYANVAANYASYDALEDAWADYDALTLGAW